MQRRELFRLGTLTGIAAVSASLPARAMPCRKDWGLSAIHLTALNLKPEDLAIQAHRAGYSAIGIRILKTVESTLSQIRRRRARGTSGLWPSSP